MVLTSFQDIDSRALFLAGGLLMLSVLFLISYKREQRHIHSGKELVRGAGRNENGRLAIDLLFHVAQPNKWYRIAAYFDLVAKSKEGFFERFEMTRHRFKLSLQDRAGGVLVNETRPFQDFAIFALPNPLCVVMETAFRFEFVPPQTGDYRITFEITGEETIKDGRFEYESGLEYFALSVREGVLPMKSQACPHEKLDLRQAANRSTAR